MSRPYVTVDVFAEAPLSGNQLAVVFEADDLTEADKLALAREFNFSETTFVHGAEPGPDGWRTDIFVKVGRIPFAGHPALGSAWAIRERYLGGAGSGLTLGLDLGPTAISFDDRAEVVWMEQSPPRFGDVWDKAEIAAYLKLDPDRIDDRWPIQEVDAGSWRIIVPLKTLADVRRAEVDVEPFLARTKGRPANSMMVFAPETYSPDNDLNCRVFCHARGVPEDPATGSAAGCLAGYLHAHRYFGSSPLDCRLEQGCEISRPSLLFLRAEAKPDRVKISVGGRVRPVCRGTLMV